MYVGLLLLLLLVKFDCFSDVWGVVVVVVVGEIYIVSQMRCPGVGGGPLSLRSPPPFAAIIAFRRLIAAICSSVG